MTFTPRVKIALLATTIVIFFLVVLLVVLPTVLVNRPDAKAALQRYLSAAFGGEVGYDQVKLMLFPRVCAALSHPRLNMPGRIFARALEVDICLKLLPLLRGRVVADSIQAQSSGTESMGSSFSPSFLNIEFEATIAEVVAASISIAALSSLIQSPARNKFSTSVFTAGASLEKICVKVL